METNNFNIETSEGVIYNTKSSKIKIVREVNVGGYNIPYEIIIDSKDLPKGKESFYLDILTKLL